MVFELSSSDGAGSYLEFMENSSGDPREAIFYYRSGETDHMFGSVRLNSSSYVWLDLLEIAGDGWVVDRESTRDFVVCYFGGYVPIARKRIVTATAA